MSCRLSAPRRASVFLVALSLLAVMVVLAFGFVRTIGIVADGARTADLNGLARSAAQSGLAHACGVIARDFLARPGVPTTLRDRYRSAFLPIDSATVGKDTAITDDDAPCGLEFTPGDLNENDIKTENLLTELYCSTSNGKDTYSGRGGQFGSARQMHPGGGRYFEVGRWNQDLAAAPAPLSFHLIHPAAPDPSSTDPAARSGENYAPDIDSPLLLDRALARAADAAQARYRCRYAIAIEDLAGHLLSGCQGTYQTGARSAAAGDTPTDADLARIVEVDRSIADRYADAFADMQLVSPSPRSYMAKPYFLGLGSRSDAMDTSSVDDAIEFSLLRGFAADVPKIGVDVDPTAVPMPAGEPDRRPDTLITPTAGRSYLGAQGAACSFAALRGLNPESTSFMPYLFTPFGHAGDQTQPAQDWRGNPTGAPWRLNLPTAAPTAIAVMLFAYLPQEFKSLRYSTRYKYDFGGTNADGSIIWNLVGTESANFRGLVPTVNLYAAPSPLATPFAHLAAAQPYPGTAPDAPGADWSELLGKDLNINWFSNSGTMADAAYCRSPLWGQGGIYGISGRPGSYLIQILDYTTLVEKEERYAGGQKWELKSPSSAYQRLTWNDGYWYGDSYWHDIAAAFAHTCAVAQLAWNGDTGAGWQGAPNAGVATYPAAWSDGEYGTAYKGQPMLDLDVDGDGAKDTPTLFRTIKDLDRQFVKNLGEWPEDQATGSRPATAHQGLYVVKGQYLTDAAQTVAWTANGNIRKLLVGGKITAGNAALMELAVNDLRMSFFGANPLYTDFQPIDFDDDGSVRCSAYAGGGAPADPLTGRGATPASRFSLTGYFVMQKSRYYRITVRGEVFDTLRQLPVAQANLESVLCLDPDGTVWDASNRAPAGARAPLEMRILAQDWLTNKYNGHRERTAP